MTPAERQVAGMLRQELSRQHGLTARERKNFAEATAPIFGTPQNLVEFRAEMERLFAWDAVPLNQDKDRFSIYVLEVLRGLIQMSATASALPWLPYLAATNVAHAEYGETVGYGSAMNTADWKLLCQEVQRVPVAYLRTAFDEEDEVMPTTMEALCKSYHAGLAADYFRALPIEGKSLPDFGYTLDDALRLQAAGVATDMCTLVYFRKRAGRKNSAESTEHALMLSAAGVPWLYAYRLFEAGLAPEDVKVAHESGLPIEYAIAASSSAA